MDITVTHKLPSELAALGNVDWGAILKQLIEANLPILIAIVQAAAAGK